MVEYSSEIDYAIAWDEKVHKSASIQTAKKKLLNKKEIALAEKPLLIIVVLS